jgi:hypothetical protein
VDSLRHGTWPAYRCGTSSVRRAKRHAYARPSAQTLGRRKAPEVLNHLLPSNQAHLRVRRCNAAQSAANTGCRWRVAREGMKVVRAGTTAASSCQRGFAVSSWFLRPRSGGAFGPRCAGAGFQDAGTAQQVRVGIGATGTSVSFATGALPNPSLERTSTGMALGPRGYAVHHPPRGPSTTPVVSAQLKR